MKFWKRTKKVQISSEEKKLNSESNIVTWVRHRGVRIDFDWNEGDEPDPEFVDHLIQNLDSIVDDGLFRLGVIEFPDTIKAVLPEWIDFSIPEGDFSLSFYCPDIEDYLLGVVFKDGIIISDWEGH